MLEGHRAQVWRHHPSFLRPRHFHDEPEINWIAAGSARMSVGAREFVVEAGDVVLLPPGLDHVLLEASADLELFVTALDRDLAVRGREDDSLLFHGQVRLDRARLQSVVEELGGLADVRDPAAHEARLAELFREARALTTPTHVVSRRAFESVCAEPSVSEVELARRLHTASSGVSRQFRKDLGVTFVEYRSRVRLMRFIDQVDLGKSFVSAALDADFGSYVQCHRVFQRALGCSPTEYFAGARHAIDAATARP